MNDTLTVSQLADRYWEYAQGYYRRGGESTRTLEGIRAAMLHLRQYGDLPAEKFGPLKLLAIQEQLAAREFHRCYCNKTCDYLKRVFKWGVSRELIPPSIFQALATVEGLRRGRSNAKESKRILPVSDAVVDATLPWLTPAVRSMVQIQRFTGCRPGEVILMRPGDIDRMNDVWQYRPRFHKTEHHGKERIIFLGPRAQAILTPYLDRDPDAYCFSPKESTAIVRATWTANRKTPLSCGNSIGTHRKAEPKRTPGDFYYRNSYRDSIKRSIRQANRAGCQIPIWRPNQLRHSVATLVRREFGLEAVQAVLGHSDMEVSQIYAERQDHLAIDVARRLG